MAQSFNITAKLQLQAGNFQPVIASLQQQLGGFSANINAGVSPASARSVAALASNIQNLQQAMAATRQMASGLNQTLNKAGSGGAAGLKQFQGQLTATQTALSSVQSSISGANSELFKLGQQAAISGRRFLAFSVGAISFVKLAGAIRTASGEALEFQHNMVRLGQLGFILVDFGNGRPFLIVTVIQDFGPQLILE